MGFRGRWVSVYGTELCANETAREAVALACTTEAELERVATALSQAGVENTGVKTDPTLNKKYVAFKDPDRIAWELYLV